MLTDDLPNVAATGVDLQACARALRGAGLWARETVCGLGGHEYLLHTDRERICLRCSACGHETPGWRFGRTARPSPGRPAIRLRGNR